jgi:DNA-binding SARP family transcriptional activator/Tfp pilus assembly protein PilF
MGTTVGTAVGMHPGPRAEHALELRLLGPLTVSRDGLPLALPRSRKVRALLGFLALTPGFVGRSRLCDLLWDAPCDPRGELRWSLSKIRTLLDSPGRPRVITRAPDLIALELGDCRVDALEIDRAAQAGFGQVAHDRLAELCDLFAGDVLDGLELDAPELTAWLAAQRHRYRGLRIAVLDALIGRAPPGCDEVFVRLQTWLGLAPFDPRPHEVLLGALVHQGRLREADDHLAATIRAFEHEGADWTGIREALRAARQAATAAQRIESTRDIGFVERPVQRRASVAVLPFVESAAGQSGRGPIADGLTDDIITGLAKLRVLFVIARGTVYALSERNIGPDEAGRILNVEFVVTGLVRRAGHRVSVVIEVAETRDARIVWTDEIHGATDEALAVLDETIGRIVAAIAEEIEAAECKRAVLKPPTSLDAWEAYHRGLWHMYRFTGPDNRHAAQFFRTSLELDPTFARAYAGLSFTHFQNAFLDLTDDREHQIEQAFAAAEQSVSADDRDPAAHWAMGRSLWLRGAQRESLAELHRSVDLSPNFALGHYTLGFVESQQGDPQSAIDATDLSRRLSPFDPLQFAMLATRAIAHVRLGQLPEAADWAVKAAARPNAHAHILAIATQCLALAGRRDEAGAFAARIRGRLPHYGVEDFLRAFRFAPDTESELRRSAHQIGFD